MTTVEHLERFNSAIDIISNSESRDSEQESSITKVGIYSDRNSTRGVEFERQVDGNYPSKLAGGALEGSFRQLLKGRQSDVQATTAIPRMQTGGRGSHVCRETREVAREDNRVPTSTH